MSIKKPLTLLRFLSPNPLPFFAPSLTPLNHTFAPVSTHLSHYATYAAAVNGFSSRKLLSETRKLLYAKLTKPSKPPAISSGLSAGFPKRKSYLGGTITHSPDAPGGPAYLIPFFFADPAIVRLTQALDATRAGNEQTDSPNIIFKAHIVIPNLLVLLIVVLNLSLFGLLANYERGRKLLLSKPGLFSGGLVSHEVSFFFLLSSA